MNTKIEDVLSDDITSQNEKEFFTNGVTMKINNDTLLLDEDCNIVIKREVKSETPIPESCSKKERECSTEHLIKQAIFETVTSVSNCKADMKTEIEVQTLVSDFGLQNKKTFVSEDPVLTGKKINNEDEIDNKIEIKEEPWWLETETSPVSNDIKDGDLQPVRSSRLCRKLVSGDSSSKSLLPFVVSGRNTIFQYGENCPEYEGMASDVSEIATVKEHSDSEQYSECSSRREMYSESLYLNKHNFMHKGKSRHKCTICEKMFTRLSHLKRHYLIHEGKKPYQCKTCDKRFTQSSSLKMHNLIHEGNKPHQCKVCDKRFTYKSALKVHNLIHEGKKPHQCKTCNKRFTRLSDLKMHKLIHEGKKPQRCKTCNKTFTQLSTLKKHNLIHEGEKPHQCKTCYKSFTELSNLNKHKLIHEGKKLHQCKTCDKKFTHLSTLKKHYLIHEGRKPHQCAICDRSFTHLSTLKKHILNHAIKKAATI